MMGSGKTMKIGVWLTAVKYALRRQAESCICEYLLSDVRTFIVCIRIQEVHSWIKLEVQYSVSHSHKTIRVWKLKALLCVWTAGIQRYSATNMI